MKKTTNNSKTKLKIKISKSKKKDSQNNTNQKKSNNKNIVNKKIKIKISKLLGHKTSRKLDNIKNKNSEDDKRTRFAVFGDYEEERGNLSDLSYSPNYGINKNISLRSTHKNYKEEKNNIYIKNKNNIKNIRKYSNSSSEYAVDGSDFERYKENKKKNKFHFMKNIVYQKSPDTQRISNEVEELIRKIEEKKKKKNIFKEESQTKIKETKTFINFVPDSERISREIEEVIRRIEEKKKQNKIKKEVISNEIICPECKESSLMSIKDFKLNFYDCKNNHKIENILINKFKETQKMLISNKSKAENYICKKHNLKYFDFCKTCKKNICNICENNHKNHELINFKDILPEQNELFKIEAELRNLIDKFKEKIKLIIKIFKKMIIQLEFYYKINNNILNNFNINKVNYHSLLNINEIKNSSQILITELNNIINTNINSVFNYSINNAYDKNGCKYNYFKNNFNNIKEILLNKNYKEELNDLNSNITSLNSFYKNDLENKKIEENNIFYFVNGDVYVGNIKNGLKEGKGILYYNNGDKFEGNFINGLKEGKGILYYNDGNKFEGDFKNDEIYLNDIKKDKLLFNVYKDKEIKFKTNLFKEY